MKHFSLPPISKHDYFNSEEQAKELKTEITPSKKEKLDRFIRLSRKDRNNKKGEKNLYKTKRYSPFFFLKSPEINVEEEAKSEKIHSKMKHSMTHSQKIPKSHEKIQKSKLNTRRAYYDWGRL